MHVTIIGTGNMGRAIATRLLAGGHEVTLLHREAGKSEELARELGGSVSAGTVGDSIAGDVIVLAVPHDAAAPLVRQYGEELSGKVVVDITNPVDWQTFDGLATPPESSAAEEIQKAAPEGARREGLQHHVCGHARRGAGRGAAAGCVHRWRRLRGQGDGSATRARRRARSDRRRAAAPGATAGGVGLPGDDAPAAAGVELPERLEAY
jgi:hypothetical protein